MKHLLLACLCLGLIGCNDSITGIFKANQDLTFNSEEGSVVVAAGNYDGKIVVKGKTRIELELEQQDVTHEVSFNIPKSFSFEENQDFEIPSDISGQPYNIFGGNETAVSYGAEQEARETCSRSIPVRRCYYDNNGHYYCNVYYETRYGHQWVRYRVKTKVSTNFMNLLDVAKDIDPAAEFVGSDTRRSREYLQVGQCYISGYPYPFHP